MRSVQSWKTTTHQPPCQAWFRPTSSTNSEKSTQSEAPQTEKETSAEDHLLREEKVTPSWSMGSPAGLRPSSCSWSLRESDVRRPKVMSDVGLPPGHKVSEKQIHILLHPSDP